MNDIPATDNPAQGKVVPQFEITSQLLEKASTYVNDSKHSYESMRTAKVEQDSNRKAWDTRLRQYDRAYRAILESDRVYKGFDDKCAPIINDNIEAIVARLKDSIVPVQKELVKINSDVIPKEIVEARSKEINTQLEKQDIGSKVEQFVRSASKFGTAVIKVPLVNDASTVMTQQLVVEEIQTPIIDEEGNQLIDANGQPMIHTETKQEIKVVPEIDRHYFGPGYDVLDDIEDLYVDPFIEDIQDQPIVIQRVIVDWEHLQKGIEAGIYFDDQVKKIKDFTSRPFSNRYNEKRKEEVFGSSSDISFQGANKDGRPKEYEMYQAWCDFAIEAEEEGEKVTKVYSCVISIIGNTAIQLMPNPYFHQMKPFVKGVYRRIEGEFYGMGAIDTVLGLFHAYNDTMNQIEDCKVLKLNGITVTKAGTLADQQDFNVEPGAVWYEKQTGDIRPYIVDFPMAEGLQYLELLEQRINRGMGITPLINGSGDSTDLDKTWRGTNKLIGQADKKFKNSARELEDACIRQVGEMMYKVNVQFNPLQVGVNTFEHVNSEAGITVDGVENFFEKQEKIESYTNFVLNAASIPGFNVPGLVNTIADMQGIKIDEEKYGPLYTPPQPPPPETKPLSVTNSIPLDPSKGPVMLFAAAQVLKQKGIDLDIDSIAEATHIFTTEYPADSKAQSGILPPGYDSYRDSDPRTKKGKKVEKSIEVST